MAGKAEIVWRALSDTGTAGYRLTRIEGDATVAVHPGWIWVDLGRSYAVEYRVEDPGMSAGRTAVYRLDELRMNGSVRLLGNWTVRFDPPVEAPVAVLAGATEAVPLQEPLSTGAAKIPVTSHDLYTVSYASIAAALGLTEGQVAQQIAQAELAMRCGDRPVSYLPDPANQRILFYGWPATNRYTRTNYFWIEPGAGAHMVRVTPDAVPVSAAQTFQSHRIIEEDVYSLVEYTVLREDLFYWRYLNAASATGNRTSFSVPLAGYAGGPLSMGVRVIGWNDTVWDPDHRAIISFNGEQVGDRAFDGKSETVVEFEVAGDKVLPSGNSLEVLAYLFPGRGSTFTSYLLVDNYELSYVRYYAPAEDLLLARDGGNARLGADLFAAPLVFDVTDPYVPRWIADESGQIPAGTSWPVLPDSRWAFRERTQLASSIPVAAGGGAWLRGTEHRVDYVVIAPRAFEAPAVALAQHRESLGLRTVVAFYEDIRDQFAGGLNTPDAIESFLKYAQAHWAAPPWMAVLCGRGSYQYLYAAASSPEWLPAQLVATSGGLCPADGQFADTLGDNGIPDIAVGRIPARSAAQFSAYVAKLVAYESAGLQPAQNRAVFLSDVYDPNAGDFKASNILMGTEASRRYTVEYQHLDDPEAAVRTAALSAYADGVGLLHYTGHGNAQLIADFGSRLLLQTSDFSGMTNPPVAAFLALTCLLGRYDHPTAIRMAEAMVLQSTGGALALYAPSGLSWNYYAEMLGVEIHRIHANGGSTAMGPLLLRARRNLGGGVYSEMFRTFNLLGDPALKLHGGSGGVAPTHVSRFEQWRWERFSTDELADEQISGPNAAAPGRTWSNFEDYAHGGYPPGLAQFDVDANTGRGHVEWMQQEAAEDVEYRLWVTGDLRGTWGPPPPETTLDRELLSDGIERITARIPYAGEKLFVRLEVVLK